MSPRASERRLPSRAAIQLRLPRTVLISPLWATMRKGWASCHEGNVLVENRECTMAKAEASRGSERSGKKGSSCIVVSIPLYRRVREDSEAKYVPPISARLRTR